jgi:hypothetical protein
LRFGIFEGQVSTLKKKMPNLVHQFEITNLRKFSGDVIVQPLRLEIRHRLLACR